MKTITPEVTKRFALSMQVCVPTNWTDDEIISFAEKENPCGTSTGWGIRKDSNLLGGSPERNQCAEREGAVHVTLDA